MMYVIDSVDLFDLSGEDLDEDDEHRSTGNSAKKEEIIVKKAINGSVLYVDTVMSAFKLWKTCRRLPKHALDAAMENFRVVKVLRVNGTGPRCEFDMDGMIDQIRKESAKDSSCLIVRNMSDIVHLVQRMAFGDLVVSDMKSITKDEMISRGGKIQEFSDKFIDVISPFKESILFNNVNSLVYDKEAGKIQQAKSYAQFYSMLDDGRLMDFYKQHFGRAIYTRKNIVDYYKDVVKNDAGKHDLLR